VLDWCRSLPKVELHLHIEGAIPIPALWQLVQKYGGDPLVPSEDALREYFRFRDFPHFIELWIWKNKFLREYEDFTFLSAAVAEELKSENIRYVEAFFSPGRFRLEGLETGRLLEAVRAGLDRVEGIEIALIPDLVRDLGPEVASEVLEEVAELRDLGVVGIGLGGSEHRFPPELFTHSFRRARALGLRTTIHAGEAAGADSVRSAIDLLDVQRIGHGTRAIEDPALMQRLADAQLPIEMCPLSNVATGVVESIADHPVRQFFDHGLMVSINSDDPAMFGHSLSEDYAALMESLSFTEDEVRTLIVNGIESSWLDADSKSVLKAVFVDDAAWRVTPAGCGEGR
jgi:adenosine deaminase